MTNRLREYRGMRVGLRGERMVGQILEDLRQHGYKVFHDIPGDQTKGEQFNIDHVLIGPAGIFAIETKARSKKGSEQVEFNGTSLLIGKADDSRPLEQAQANAKWLYGLLREMTGKSWFVKPVVVFPDWWVNNRRQDTDIWVDNPKQLFKRIGGAPEVLREEDVHAASSSLSRYCRNAVMPH